MTSPRRMGGSTPGARPRRGHGYSASTPARAHGPQGQLALTPPVPFASILYGRMVAIENRINSSWRGLGTEEAARSLAGITAQVDALEDQAGPGMAWTAVDEVLARAAAKGAACVDTDHLDWLALCFERADVPMPAGYRSDR